MRLDGLVSKARNEVREITPDAIAHDLAAYIVVDVREPEEVLHGYLPDAVNVPRGVLEHGVIEVEQVGPNFVEDLDLFLAQVIGLPKQSDVPLDRITGLCVIERAFIQTLDLLKEEVDLP